MSCTVTLRRSVVSLFQVLALVMGLTWSPSIQAESTRPRLIATTHTPEQLESTLTSIPVRLPGGSSLTVITPAPWREIAQDLLEVVSSMNATHAELFARVPPFKTSLRLMDEETFFGTTGAPKWTNALFLRGQIIIPISPTAPVDRENLRRSVKHEYTHALLSAISGGKIPGWIDEGLAQLMEGDEHPTLHKALRQWLTTNDPIPFRLLQGGFTRLPNHMVAAAYAQSLVTVQALMRTYGIGRITTYLHALREGHASDDAFLKAFGLSAAQLERRLHHALQRWSGTQRASHIQVAAYSAPTDGSYSHSRSSLGSR